VGFPFTLFILCSGDDESQDTAEVIVKGRGEGTRTAGDAADCRKAPTSFFFILPSESEC
jgi:hypothetical protein